MQARKDWKKIVYKESDDNVRVIQGLFSDKGDFIEIKGDYKTILINKPNVVSIQTINKQAGGNGGL